MMSNVSLNDRTVENETTTARSTIRLSFEGHFLFASNRIKRLHE